MTRLPEEVRERLRRLTSEFSRYLSLYDEGTPFTRSGQLEHHEATLRRLGELSGDPLAAVDDERFVRSLYATLKAWGIGVRGSRLRPPAEFAASLQAEKERLAALRASTIADQDLFARGADQRVWELIEELDIVESDAKLVALTKTLHHLLPRLVVPIDRLYTGRFFGWSPAAMQYQQRPLFFEAFAAFNQLAMSVDLEAHVGTGWRSAPSKLIDNAIVAFCKAELSGQDVSVKASKRTGGKYEPLREYLASVGGTVEQSFSEIDALVGGLPPSARNHREWWGNASRNVQARAWMDAGKKVAMVNLGKESIRFVPTAAG